MHLPFASIALTYAFIAPSLAIADFSESTRAIDQAVIQYIEKEKPSSEYAIATFAAGFKLEYTSISSARERYIATKTKTEAKLVPFDQVNLIQSEIRGMSRGAENKEKKPVTLLIVVSRIISEDTIDLCIGPINGCTDHYVIKHTPTGITTKLSGRSAP